MSSTTRDKEDECQNGVSGNEDLFPDYRAQIRPATITALIYARERGTKAHTRRSIEKQKQTCRKLAKAHGITIVGCFYDAEDDRGLHTGAGLHGMLNHLIHHRDICYVLVDSLARIACSVSALSSMLLTLKATGTRLHAVLESAPNNLLSPGTEQPQVLWWDRSVHVVAPWRLLQCSKCGCELESFTVISQQGDEERLVHCRACGTEIPIYYLNSALIEFIDKRFPEGLAFGEAGIQVVVPESGMKAQ
jgi:hypothetical protein